MTDVEKHTEDWQTIPWKAFQRNVYRLQKRIYQAERRGDRKQVHNLQRMLMRSWSARCLAVRQVTQDNRGKRTAGVDGVAALPPKQRLEYALRLAKLPKRAAPVRRVYIPKPSNPDERRPLGIPTMYDRAAQALVKLALEPQWEACFEANSYGFRPGRGAHDAIEAIFKAIERKPKYVLDADIEKCFDRINHEQLLAKLHAIQPITCLVRAWLKAGIVDGDEMLFPEAGTPQGGVVSPLLANVALHGLESHLIKACPSMRKPSIIRYADDFVILHEDLEVLRALREQAETWLVGMGLRLKASKTHISHTLQATDGAVGFDFLGFTVRQYPVGKYRTNTFRGQPGYKTFIKPSRKAQKRHVAALRETVRNHQGQAQAALIGHLNPLIRGWSNYYRACVAAKVFTRMDTHLYYQLFQWATYRHAYKTDGWCYRHYWRRVKGRVVFSDGKNLLTKHMDTRIQRHVKVKWDKSPFDGDWVYWSTRMGRDPSHPAQWVKLLKRQDGQCGYCGLRFMTVDVLEVHHRDGNRQNYSLRTLVLLHGHCHDQVHSSGKRL